MLREAAPRDFAALLGRAWAVSIGVYNTARLATEERAANMLAAPDLHKTCLDAGKRCIDAALLEWERMGFSVANDTETNSLGRMVSRLDKGLSKYIAKDPIPSRWRIVDVEKDLGEAAGYARPDLIVRDDVGLAVVDYKLRVKLPAEWRVKAVQEYAHSNQMLHYASFVGEAYGEPISRFYIGLGVLEPNFLFDLLTYPIHEETLKIWRQATQVVWGHMESEDKGEVPPFMAAEHSDRYGRCEYYKACFDHHYDPYLMNRDYLHVERVKRHG